MSYTFHPILIGISIAGDGRPDKDLNVQREKRERESETGIGSHQHHQPSSEGHSKEHLHEALELLFVCLADCFGKENSQNSLLRTAAS